MIITATGLNLQAFGGLALTVDGEPVHLPDHLAYKGMMLSDVPNFVFTIGYTNASWTLKADLVAEFTCRILTHMAPTATPPSSRTMPRRRRAQHPLLDFEAGYVQRSLHLFPAGPARRPRGGSA